MTPKRPRRVLIAGLGVAGATLAWWLAEYGFEVSVVERATAARTGGHMIDFWGLGYDVAERMGVLGELRACGYLIDEIRLVEAGGGRLATIGAEAMRRSIGDRFFSLMRGDLVDTLCRCVRDRTVVRFGDSIQWLIQRDTGVEVGFATAASEKFDFVVGAEGIHSPTRATIVNAPCEHPLGYWTASFSAEAYPHRDPGSYVSFTKVGLQAVRYALREDRSAFFFVFRAPGPDSRPPHALLTRKLSLQQIYGGLWECDEILDRLDARTELYFDSVDQVRAPRWSSGRIALVGDAAYCPSLLAGEGASLAMAGAYVLAGELHRCDGDHLGAFERYERLLRPMIERKQRGALRMGGWFAPKSALGLRLRNGLSRLAAMPSLAPFIVGGMLSNDVTLPDYRA